MKTFVHTPVVLLASSFLALGCATSDPTSAVVDNGYPAPAGSDVVVQTTVYKVWWFVAGFPDPVAAGQQSDPVRVVPGTDYAYALLAPGWDPSSVDPPTTLIPVRTEERVSVERGGILPITISDATTLGSCAAGRALPADDATFIVERIFPGEFASVSYDPATCTTVPLADDGGVGRE